MAQPDVQSAAPRSSLLSDTTLSTLGAIGGTALSGVASILIARGLGVTGRGRWAVISSLAVVVATVAATGLPIAASYAAARLQGEERSDLVRAALTGALGFSLLAAVVYLVAAVVIRPPDSTAAVALGALIPFASVIYTVTHQLTLTVARMRPFAWAQIASAIVTLAAVIALYAAGRLTVLAVVCTSTAGAVAGGVICIRAVVDSAALGSRLFLPARRAARTLRPYLAYALITFATLSLTQIVQRVDILLVNGYRGAHAAGLYSVAVQVTDLMLVVPGALGLVAFRRSATSTEDHYGEALAMLRFTGAFGVTAALFALATAGFLIPHVFGEHYGGSVAPLRLLLPGTIAFSLQSVLSQYLAGRGRPRIVLIAWTTGAIVGIGADLFVIPAYGIKGAAVVSSVSYLLVTGLHVQGLRALRQTDA